MKKTIQTRLDPSDIKLLEKEAEKTGHTLSSLIRYLVRKFLDDIKKRR